MPTDPERLVTVYYLLLQDRFAEAHSAIPTIDRSAMRNSFAVRLLLRLPANDTRQAAGSPRNRGRIIKSTPSIDGERPSPSVRSQLDEIDGRSGRAVDAQDRNQQQDELAAAQPSLDLSIDSQTVRIRYRRVSEVRVNYYLMEVELLFSRNPFVQRYSNQFSYIQPHVTQEISLTDPEGTQTIPLPEQLQNQNLLIEVQAAGLRQSQPYFAHSLSVELIESYGQLRVKDTNTASPLPRVYVKVYAILNNGQVQFYKDGYTDLRGRFDYSSLSTNLLDSVRRFSILVLSEQNGAVIREVSPPKR